MPGPAGRRVRRWVTAAAALLELAVTAAVVRTAGPAGSVDPDRTLTVATWNMCGVRQWNCAGTGGQEAKRRGIEALATRSGARAVLLQEACAADVRAARTALGRAWHTAFLAYTWRDGAGRRTTVRCAGAGRGAAGIAILAAYPLSRVVPLPARQPSRGLGRGILCASVAAHDVRLCNAHLSPAGSDLAHPGWELRDDQMRALVAAVPRRRTVYGGDLNTPPPGPGGPSSWVWPSAPFTVHRECDQASGPSRAGRATHTSGHKLDYLFTGLPRVRCTVRDTGVSDHMALLAGVRTG
ncbi:endonuclease/exonuclease/phosphatase family protein [Streptomyces sp. PRKS01-65]|nr:endonuclease/exonuclease/phosphatase family protein [Streptomyces harenosi]